MRALIIIAALWLAACRAEMPPAEKPEATFACYMDGNATIVIEAKAISMNARMVNGVMHEHWVVELPKGEGDVERKWIGHDADPGEVCGPEVLPSLVD